MCETIAVNLLSVSKIAAKGNTVIFDKNGCKVKNADGDVIANGQEKNGVYKLIANSGKCLISKTESAFMWQRMLGHLNYASLKRMRDGAVTGINFIDEKSEIANCETCAKEKLARLPFGKSESRSKQI